MIKQLSRRKTVSRKIALIVVMAILAVSAVSVSISLFRSKTDEYEKCAKIAELASAKVALCLDGDLIEEQFRLGKDAPNYDVYQKQIEEISKSDPLIKYLYVYKVMESGVYAVFDVDMPSMDAFEPGVRIENDPDIYNRIEEFLKGGEIPMGNSNDPYGSLLTAYTPVYDSNGNTVAYACCDIETSNYNHKVFVDLLRDLVLILLASLIALFFINKLLEKHVTKPIQLIMDHKRELMEIPAEQWLDSDVWKNKRDVKTNDEFEDLYNEVIQMEENISHNVKKQLETERANREKTDFLSRMSHDMRTPMNGIMGLAELSEEESDISVLKENIKKIEQSGRYLLCLINDTLDFQKIESGKIKLEPQIVSTKELVTNVLMLIRLDAKKKDIDVQMTTEDANLDCMVKVDPVRMKQIFFNLLSNAVKFTQPGGVIRINIKCKGHTGNIAHDEISITDTGIGMSKDFIKNRIFQPFSQEHSDVVTNYSGSGLGLSIAKKLIELMQGSIDVASELGTGTTFTIKIDFERAEDAEVQSSVHQTELHQQQIEKSLNGLHVLLAEDHPLNAEIATRLLTKVGCEVQWADDGQKCLDVFNASEEKYFDVILMDVRMPNMDGITATREIRRQSRSDAQTIPIIAMTANAYHSDVQVCLEAGMNAHIAKPIETQMLFDTIARNVSRI